MINSWNLNLSLDTLQRSLDFVTYQNGEFNVKLTSNNLAISVVELTQT